MNHGSNFWIERLRIHGHTGWADPIIYIYDQLERLRLVEQVVSTIPIRSAMALDFGCGTGDFSKLLLRMGFSVCGYDPFVKPSIRAKEFVYADRLSDVAMESADLALSVTALDHVLEEGELHQALDTIRRSLRLGGRFLMLEYALEPEDLVKFPSKSGYQSFRLLSTWRELLESHSFDVMNVTSVPHPHHNPSSGYLAFTRSVLVRLRRRASSTPVASWLDPFLRWAASRYVQETPTPVKKPSPVKLIHSCAR